MQISIICLCGKIRSKSRVTSSLGKLPETRLDNRRNTAKAGQDLQAVVDADESVIARIRSQVVLLHCVVTRRRHSREVAEAPFHKGTEVGAVLLAAGAGLDAAAHVELTLCNGRDVRLEQKGAKRRVVEDLRKQEYFVMSYCRIFLRRRHCKQVTMLS